jgi:hypothetical protein
MRGESAALKHGFALVATICEKLLGMVDVRRARRQLKEPGLYKEPVKSVLGDMVTKGGEMVARPPCRPAG